MWQGPCVVSGRELEINPEAHSDPWWIACIGRSFGTLALPKTSRWRVELLHDRCPQNSTAGG